MADQLDVVERIPQILQGGAYSSTYKLAVLVALMDLCVENPSAMGWPATTITTHQRPSAFSLPQLRASQHVSQRPRRLGTPPRIHQPPERLGR